MAKDIKYLLFATYLFTGEAMAAGGPIAKGFGADDWMDKLHVLLTVVGLVVFVTIALVYAILRKK